MASTVGKTTKSSTEIDELLDAPMPTVDEYNLLCEKKNKNKATRLDKMSIEKYKLIKKFQIKESDFTANFLHDWKGKEYILDNVLYYIGKLKLSTDDDQYLNTMKQRKVYVDQLIAVYGFKGLFDFKTTVQKDEEMEKRMKDSNFLKWDNYVKIMMCFGKRMYREKEDNKFSINAFVVMSEALFSEFAVELKCQKHRKQKNKEIKWIFDYKLSLQRIGIEQLVKTKKIFKKN